MFRTIKTIKRPKISIPFYHEIVPEADENYRREFFTRYIQTGKFLGTVKKISEDRLTLEIISDWKDRDSFKECATDESEHIQKFIDESNSYITEHGFIMYYTFEEIK